MELGLGVGLFECVLLNNPNSGDPNIGNIRNLRDLFERHASTLSERGKAVLEALQKCDEISSKLTQKKHAFAVNTENAKTRKEVQEAANLMPESLRKAKGELFRALAAYQIETHYKDIKNLDEFIDKWVLNPQENATSLIMEALGKEIYILNEKTKAYASLRSPCSCMMIDLTTKKISSTEQIIELSPVLLKLEDGRSVLLYPKQKCKEKLMEGRGQNNFIDIDYNSSSFETCFPKRSKQTIDTWTQTHPEFQDLTKTCGSIREIPEGPDAYYQAVAIAICERSLDYPSILTSLTSNAPSNSPFLDVQDIVASKFSSLEKKAQLADLLANETILTKMANIVEQQQQQQQSNLLLFDDSFNLDSGKNTLINPPSDLWNFSAITNQTLSKKSSSLCKIVKLKDNHFAIVYPNTIAYPKETAENWKKHFYQDWNKAKSSNISSTNPFTFMNYSMNSDYGLTNLYSHVRDNVGGGCCFYASLAVGMLEHESQRTILHKTIEQAINNPLPKGASPSLQQAKKALQVKAWAASQAMKNLDSLNYSNRINDNNNANDKLIQTNNLAARDEFLLPILSFLRELAAFTLRNEIESSKDATALATLKATLQTDYPGIKNSDSLDDLLAEYVLKETSDACDPIISALLTALEGSNFHVIALKNPNDIKPVEMNKDKNCPFAILRPGVGHYVLLDRKVV